MPYDFMTLSPEDFEHLTRDVLSQEWGYQLESFKGGKDKGIDLRHSRAKNSAGITIIQCKRFAPHRLSSLFQSVKNEIPKIKKLNPPRYVLVTSVPLSAHNKDELLKLLHPYCKGPGDIFGASEINGLLNRHPEIEKAHFKLWISSTTVLERVLNARIFNLTDDTVSALKDQMCRLVMHKGFENAQKILQENHHVLIVGNPGIGKTTLAKMLMCHYIHDQFTPIVVAGDIADAWQTITSSIHGSQKAVILYDDFLGQIRFNESKFQKNEERSLLNLLNRARKTPNLRLLLTTREYILADARRLHGAFDEQADQLIRCILSLDDYSNDHRARILYNHLYFSDLPESRLATLVAQKIYRKVIEHRHFSPRIVEAISIWANSKAMTDSDYVSYVVNEFENPSRVWHHPFANQISPTSRQLLQILWSMGEEIDRAALERCLVAFNQSERPEDVLARTRDSLKELDGNFIATERYTCARPKGKEIIWIVKFQNPAVEEYLESVVTDDPILMERLISSATRFEQVAHFLSCVETRKGQKPILRRPPTNFWALLWQAAIRTQTTPEGIRVSYGVDKERYYDVDSASSLARRTLTLLKIGRRANASDVNNQELIARVTTLDGWKKLLSKVPSDNSEPYGVKFLLEWSASKFGLDKQHRSTCIDSFRTALQSLFEVDDAWPIDVSGVSVLFESLSSTGTKLTIEEQQGFERVGRAAARSVIDNIDDSDALEAEAVALRELAQGVGFNADALANSMDERARSMRDSAQNIEKDDYDEYRYDAKQDAAVDVDELFSTLLDK